MSEITLIIGLCLGAYLIGSIPWGLILAGLFAGIDIRQHGSGNVGASNVRRLAGNKLGLATLALDAAKGALPALVGLHTINPPNYHLAAFAILAAICGHIFPVFLKFKPSGKGVATAAGAFIVVAPLACLVSSGVFLLLAMTTRRISPGSIGAAATLPLAILLINRRPLIGLLALIVAGLIISRHQDNIIRLFKGKEPRWDK